MRLLTLCALAAALAAQGFEPPRLRSAALPTRQPPDVIVGGEVLLELTVHGDGGVHVTSLSGTPPFMELLRDAVARWRFEPAREDGRSLEWPVLVAALFRAPVLAGPAPPSPARAREPGRPVPAYLVFGFRSPVTPPVRFGGNR